LNWRCVRAWKFRVLMLAGLTGLLGQPLCALAQPRALDDEAMSEVCGRDGVGFAVHLEMNSGLLDGKALDSRLVSGYTVNGQTTYQVAYNVGGIIDLIALTINVRGRPDGGDYIDLGLPGFVGVKNFGYRALGAQTDPSAAVSNSYGQLLLNGHAAMQGHLYLWAQ